MIDAELGRMEDAMLDFSHKLEAKGGAYEKVERISSDMSEAYRNRIQHCFFKVWYTIDRFHVKKLLLDGMDEVRRVEQ